MLDPVMEKKLLAFFSPCLTLLWNDKLKLWVPERRREMVQGRLVWMDDLLRQFIRETDLPKHPFPLGVRDEDYDKVLAAAGDWGWCLETVGGPEA